MALIHTFFTSYSWQQRNMQDATLTEDIIQGSSFHCLPELCWNPVADHQTAK